jgi:signal transduction histidine kinase
VNNIHRTRLLAVLVFGAFGLTMACFVASAVFVRHKENIIDHEVIAILENAGPSVYHLATARSELRHFETLLIRYVGARPRDPVLRTRLEGARRGLEIEWTRYLSLPTFADERRLWPPIITAFQQLDLSLGKLLALAERGNTPSATLQGEMDQMEGQIDQLDGELARIREFNTEEASAAANTIETTHTLCNRIALGLEFASVLFGTLLASLLGRLVLTTLRESEHRASELEHFAGRVAHDIMSPLSTAALALELARRTGERDERMEPTLQRGVRSLERVRQVVDSLLSFARAGGRPEPGARAEVAVAFDTVRDELSAAAKQARIELDFEPCPPVIVSCAPGILMSVLLNLVNNAIRHMGDAGPTRSVTVRCQPLPDARWVRLEVQDTGPGVPKELRGSIFEPHVRSDRSQGFGLGLATVRRLVEAHRGRLGFTTATPGGSTFWVEWPRFQSTAS